MKGLIPFMDGEKWKRYCPGLIIVAHEKVGACQAAAIKDIVDRIDRGETVLIDGSALSVYQQMDGRWERLA